MTGRETPTSDATFAPATREAWRKLVDAVLNGSLPLAVFNQAIARILYQEERFGLIGCDNTTAACA